MATHTKYIAADGVEFYDDFYAYRDYNLALLRLRGKWIIKKKKLFWKIMFILFNIEPKKPYNF